jgi:Uma2 family endonuclease
MPVAAMPFTFTPPLPVYRLSVGQYHEMIRAGILTQDDPVELLEGVLVPRAPVGEPHRFAHQALSELLSRLVPAGWFVDDQEPITTADSALLPDLAVFRRDRRQYLLEERHPRLADVGVVVKVSDTSLYLDRTTKQRIFARAGVPSYWIVNLGKRQVEVYSDPARPGEAPAYRHHQDFTHESHVPLVLDGREVARLAVGELFL